MFLRLFSVFALRSAFRRGGHGNAVAAGRPFRNSPVGLRVVLIDDDEILRSGLRSLLEEQGIGVVAEVAILAAGVQEVRKTRPDVVVFDPDVPGAETRRQIAALAALAPVLVLTNVTTEETVIEAVVAGASGYLLKGVSIDELVYAITASAAGGLTMSPEAATALRPPLRARAPETAAAHAIGRKLSERELEVLKLLTEGKGNIEIAEVLAISPKTVQHHVSSILEKLGAENRIQAAVYAARSGIL
jgi:DNA-binding NarL/FixJ family response regulator